MGVIYNDIIFTVIRNIIWYFNHYAGVTFDSKDGKLVSLMDYIRGIINWEQMVNLLFVKDGDNNAEEGYLFNRYYGKYIHHISALLLYHIGVNLLKTVSNLNYKLPYRFFSFRIRNVKITDGKLMESHYLSSEHYFEQCQICRRVLAIIDLSKLTKKFDIIFFGKDGDNEFKDGNNNNNNNNNDNEYKYDNDDDSKEEEKQMIDNSNNTKNKPKNDNNNNNNKFKDGNNDNGVSVDIFTCNLFKKRLHIANNE